MIIRPVGLLAEIELSDKPSLLITYRASLRQELWLLAYADTSTYECLRHSHSDKILSGRAKHQVPFAQSTDRIETIAKKQGLSV